MKISELNISINPSKTIKRSFLWFIVVIIIGLNLNFFVPISTDQVDGCHIEKYGFPFIASQYAYRNEFKQCPGMLTPNNYLIVLVNSIIYFIILVGAGEFFRKKMYKSFESIPKTVPEESKKIYLQLDNFYKWEFVQNIFLRMVYIIFSIPLILPITSWIYGYESHGRSFDFEFIRFVGTLAALVLIVTVPFLAFYFGYKNKESLFGKLEELRVGRILWIAPILVFMLYCVTLYVQLQFKVIQWGLLILFAVMLEFFIYRRDVALNLLQNKLGIHVHGVGMQFILRKYFVKSIFMILILIAIAAIVVGLVFIYGN